MKCKNQISLEFLGNNFFDQNSNAEVGLFSFGYQRKIVFEHVSLMATAGVGFFTSNHHDANNHLSQTTDLSTHFGSYIRGNYKRNGIWLGLFATLGHGDLTYLRETQSNIEQFNHRWSYQLSPNFMYVYQNRSEHFLYN